MITPTDQRPIFVYGAPMTRQRQRQAVRLYYYFAFGSNMSSACGIAACRSWRAVQAC